MMSCEGNIKTNFTMTVDSLGGTSIKTQSVIEGHTADKPQTPTKDGYEFKGWYLDYPMTTDSKRYLFDEPVLSNITLYAKWENELLPVNRDIVDFDLATFDISTDHIKISEINSTISVSVIMTAKDYFEIEMYTSSYGKEGIIEMRIVQVLNDDQ